MGLDLVPFGGLKAPGGSYNLAASPVLRRAFYLAGIEEKLISKFGWDGIFSKKQTRDMADAMEKWVANQDWSETFHGSLGSYPATRIEDLLIPKFLVDDFIAFARAAVKGFRVL